MVSAALCGKLTHDPVEPRLALKADPRPIGELDETAIDSRVVGKAAEIAEHARIGFGAAETKAARNRERHLVAAMRKQRAATKAVALQHPERLYIVPDPVGLRRIDL